jgi:hypothetical protein
VGSSLNNSSERRVRTLAEHWDGANWSIDSTVPSPGGNATLLAASAVSANDVWAVGEAYLGLGDYDGIVVHRGPGGWAQIPFDAAGIPGCPKYGRSELDAVKAVGPNDVYVAGWCQSRAFVEHWDGLAWTLTLQAPARSAFYEIDTAPDGDVWVAGNRDLDSGFLHPIVYHGRAATSWTQVPVRHSMQLAGNVDALLVASDGVTIAGQLTDPHGNPTQTWALRYAGGKWHKQPTTPNGGEGYARVHAGTVQPGGDQWLGGTTVGGASSLDPQSLVLRREPRVSCAGRAQPAC